MLSHQSCVQVFVTLQTVVCQAPLSLGFCRQENWSGIPFPPPGDLPTEGLNPGLFTTSTTCQVINIFHVSTEFSIIMNIVQNDLEDIKKTYGCFK